MIKKISILGCGWLGLPLGEELVEQGLTVKGSTTRKEKAFFLYDKGIEPFILSFNPQLKGKLSKHFFDTEALIVSIPPSFSKNGDGTDFLQRIDCIIAEILEAKIKKVIFTSSTSVYGNQDQNLTETSTLAPDTQRAKALQIAESKFLNEKKFKTTILRIGGMVGKDRHPGRFFSAAKGKQEGGLTPVNLIHQTDVVDIIVQFLQQDKWGGIYNLVSDTNCTKKQFYTFATLSLEMAPVIFTKENSLPDRIISNKKLKKTLQYKFKFPDLEAVFCTD